VRLIEEAATADVDAMLLLLRQPGRMYSNSRKGRSVSYY
jgi:hypothetical protein